jgi:hypothetical protein
MTAGYEDQKEGWKIVTYLSLFMALINGYSHGNVWVSVALYVLFIISLLAQG